MNTLEAFELQSLAAQVNNYADSILSWADDGDWERCQRDCDLLGEALKPMTEIERAYAVAMLNVRIDGREDETRLREMARIRRVEPMSEIRDGSEETLSTSPDSHLFDVIEAAEKVIAKRAVATPEERQVRIENCMHKRLHFDENGLPRYVAQPCRQWRYGCRRCLQYRADQMRKLIESAMESRTVWVVRLASQDTAAIVREHGKENIRRLPMAKDVCLFVAADDQPHPKAQALTPEMVKGLDWKAIVKTPERKKVSGTLGGVAPEPDTEVIEVPSMLITGLDEEQIAECAIEAIEATPEPIPSEPTKEDLQRAIDARSEACERIVVEHGGAVSTFGIQLRVKLMRISWLTSTDDEALSRIRRSLRGLRVARRVPLRV